MRQIYNPTPATDSKRSLLDMSNENLNIWVADNPYLNIEVSKRSIDSQHDFYKHTDLLNQQIKDKEAPNSLRESIEFPRPNILRAKGIPSHIIIKVDKKTPIDASPHHPFVNADKKSRPYTQIA